MVGQALGTLWDEGTAGARVLWPCVGTAEPGLWRGGAGQLPGLQLTTSPRSPRVCAERVQDRGRCLPSGVGTSAAPCHKMGTRTMKWRGVSTGVRRKPGDEEAPGHRRVHTVSAQQRRTLLGSCLRDSGQHCAVAAVPMKHRWRSCWGHSGSHRAGFRPEGGPSSKMGTVWVRHECPQELRCEACSKAQREVTGRRWPEGDLLWVDPLIGVDRWPPQAGRVWLGEAGHSLGLSGSWWPVLSCPPGPHLRSCPSTAQSCGPWMASGAR